MVVVEEEQEEEEEEDILFFPLLCFDSRLLLRQDGHRANLVVCMHLHFLLLHSLDAITDSSVVRLVVVVVEEEEEEEEEEDILFFPLLCFDSRLLLRQDGHRANLVVCMHLHFLLLHSLDAITDSSVV